MKSSKKTYSRKPKRDEYRYSYPEMILSDSMLENREAARKFLEENPITPELLEELRKLPKEED